jgi:hypothetical protein
MKVRKVGVAALASALALGGMIAGSVGVASAKKPVLQGTLSCVSSGSTAINPPLLLQASQLPKGKDKASKYTTNATGSACTGTIDPGSAPMPSGFTLSGKAKGVTRLVEVPAALCNAPGRSSKTKITFNTGDKVKANLVSATTTLAFTPTGPHTGTSTPFPPCGSSNTVATNFAIAHLTDRIETKSSGLSLGKAYLGKNIKTDSVTQETIGSQLSAASGAGIALLHGDPNYGSFTIGL